MGIYKLMNRDSELAKFECIGNTLVKYEITSKVVYNLIDNLNIERWITYKVNPSERYQIRRALKSNGIIALEQYMQITNAISFNDTLWVKNIKSSTNWKDINPYRHTLNCELPRLLKSDNFNRTERSKRFWKSPELTTGGSYTKFWVSRDNIPHIIKFGSRTYSEYSEEEPCSEYFSFLIAKQLGIKDIVKYRLIKYKGIIATDCSIFTNERLGYVGIHNTKYEGLNLRQQMRLYDRLESLEEFREMLLLDSLTYNTDRHGNNFGFTIDNETLKIIKLNPIFDNNLSLFPGLDLNVNNSIIMNNVKYSYPRTLGDTFTAQGKLVLNERLEANLKNMYPFKLDIGTNIELDKRRISFIEAIVNRQIKLILS